MAGLPDLVVRLAANSDKFDKGMKSAKSSVSSFSSVAKTALGGVQVAMVAATAGAVAFAGAVWGLSGRISKLAGIADEAKKTGLSGQFLQRLGYAADQSGVSVETLTMGVKNLALAVGKGDEKPFAKLGLSLKELQGLEPDQQFIRVSRAIAGIETPAGRMSAAMSVFGRSGKDMAGLFAGGLDEVNDLLKEAARLGIGVSEEDLDRAAAADDAIQRMKMSFGALVDKLAVSLAPAFESVTNAITEWIVPLNQAMDAFNAMPDKAQFLSEVFTTAFSLVTESIKQSWDDMLAAMLAKTAQAAGKLVSYLGPAGYVLDTVNALGQPGLPVAEGAGVDKLQQAKAQMAGLMGQLRGSGGAAPAWQGPKQQATKGSGDFGGLFGTIKDQLSGPIAQATMAGQGIVARTMLDLNWLGNVASQAFTGERAKTEAAKAFEPRTAGAMQRGGAEAYSTLVQAMMRGTKDPVVQATEKQTQQLIKHLKPKPQQVFQLIGDFLT